MLADFADKDSLGNNGAAAGDVDAEDDDRDADLSGAGHGKKNHA